MPSDVLGDIKLPSQDTLIRHKKFIDETLRTIINGITPFKQPKYWKDLSAEYIQDYTVIKEFQKCSKYKVPEYRETNELTAVDEFISSLAPNELQFKFLVEHMNKEGFIKGQYKKAVQYLYGARMIIDKANTEITSLRQSLIKSGVLDSLKYPKLENDKFPTPQIVFPQLNLKGGMNRPEIGVQPPQNQITLDSPEVKVSKPDWINRISLSASLMPPVNSNN